MTVINVRGTSGSGKSFIAYKLMGLYATREDIKLVVAGRERVIGVRVKNPGRRDLVFAGRYTSTCGGCDTISWKGAADDIVNWIKEWSVESDVFFEGLMISSWAIDRLLGLCKDQGAHLIQLTTPLEACLNAVRSRRTERATAKGIELPPLNPKNTTAKFKNVSTGGQALKSRGANIEFLDREGAYRKCLELLNLQET